MTYIEAWEITSGSTYEQAKSENWGDAWQQADDFIRVADYDLQCGVIKSVHDYDE